MIVFVCGNHQENKNGNTCIKIGIRNFRFTLGETSTNIHFTNLSKIKFHLRLREI